MPKPQLDIRTIAREQFSGVLAIHPDYADAIANGNAPRAGYYDDDEEDVAPYVRRGNIAIVSIRGCLSQKGGYWWDGHEAIRARIERALSDTNISAVVLEINSPGGVVAGCWDNINAVLRAKAISKKPIFGYAREHAYSAAAAWACTCDEFYLPDSGGTGSIGVLQILVDYSKFLDESGIKPVVVRSGDRKARGNGYEALDEETIAEVQRNIDMLAEQFFALVSNARGLAVTKIREYEGACFSGAIAVQKKLADGVLSWDAFLEKADAAGKKNRMKAIALALGLREDASEQECVTVINSHKEKIAANDARYEKLCAQNADTAIEFALRTGRIKAGQKESERATLLDSPINGTKALLARDEMCAITMPSQERKPVDAGNGPASKNEWAQWDALDDKQLAQWYASIIMDQSALNYLAANNAKLFSRAKSAFEALR